MTIVPDYRPQLQALLPPGPAWPRDPDAVLSKLLSGFAPPFEDAHRRALQLLDQVVPATTTEMLVDWERVCGLPDKCSSPAESFTERRLAVLTRLNAIGGQSPGYFEDLAASFGFEIEIREYHRFRVGQSAAGDVLADDNADAGDAGWVFIWAVRASARQTFFEADLSTVGDPLARYDNAPLECLLDRFRPAHTTIHYAWTRNRESDEIFQDNTTFTDGSGFIEQTEAFSDGRAFDDGFGFKEI